MTPEHSLSSTAKLDDDMYFFPEDLIDIPNLSFAGEYTSLSQS